MIELQHWHPVCGEDELGAAPLAVRVLGREGVLWRDGEAVHAFVDQCPHRGAGLSLGRVVTIEAQGPGPARRDLQCAYHGWCFDGAGACRQVPSVPGFVPPSGHRATAWRTHRAHGLVWVALGDAPPAPPALAGLPPREVICGPYTVATSAPRAIENFLDTSHFGFVHAGVLGDSAHTEVPDHTVSSTPDGRPTIERYPAWQPRASASALGGAWVEYRYEVLAPYAAVLQKKPAVGADAGPGAGGPEDAYAAFACPLDEETTRIWFVQFTSDGVTPAAELQAFQDMIFGQDRAVLESQRPRRLPLPDSPVAQERHAASDRLSMAYRRWLRTAGVTYGVC